MKKLALSIVFLSIHMVHVSAMSCTDLQINLSKNNETEDVFKLQNFLTEKGFLIVSPNGYFGPNTLRAVRVYQDSIGLPDNGEVTLSVRQAIKNETCTNQTKINLNPQQIETILPVTNIPNNSSPSSFCVTFATDLIKGNEGKDVLTLQNFLMRRGLLMVAPNSYFGPSTFKAVKDYQQSVGLSETGEVHALTKAVIKNETCKENTSGTILIQGIVAVGSPASQVSVATSSVMVDVLPNGRGLSFLPKSTHMKLSVITLRSLSPVTVVSLNLKASSSLASSTVSNFTITDVLADKIINGGPVFIFTNQTISENQVKIYEIYADIGDVPFSQKGQVDFTGDIVTKDIFGTSSTTIPKFSISISP